MTDANKVINPQHLGSDLTDIWIRIWINLEILIRILDCAADGRAVVFQFVVCKLILKCFFLSFYWILMNLGMNDVRATGCIIK